MSIRTQLRKYLRSYPEWKFSPPTIQIDCGLKKFGPEYGGYFLDPSLAVGAAVTYRRTIEVAKTLKSIEGIWPVNFLTFYFLYSMTETSFLPGTDLFWMLNVATALAVQRVSERRQLELRAN